MNGWTVTVWVDAPDDWNGERVREEVDTIFTFSKVALDEASQDGLTLNTVHTPQPDAENQRQQKEHQP